jgi:hypothetical protein
MAVLDGVRKAIEEGDPQGFHRNERRLSQTQRGSSILQTRGQGELDQKRQQEGC